MHSMKNWKSQNFSLNALFLDKKSVKSMLSLSYHFMIWFHEIFFMKEKISWFSTQWVVLVSQFISSKVYMKTSTACFHEIFFKWKYMYIAPQVWKLCEISLTLFPKNFVKAIVLQWLIWLIFFQWERISCFFTLCVCSTHCGVY